MEKISCICLTVPGRERFLQRAVRCFNEQTYENRELIVVGDPGMDISIEGSGALYVPTSEKLTIGAKRNLACESATGTLFAVWDDDDFSFPKRLEIQERYLYIYLKSVTAFDQIPFVQDDKWWLSPKDPMGVIGTSLFFTRSFWLSHPFPDVPAGEDVEFTRAAQKEKEFHLAPDAEVMFATNHGSNTSKDRVMPLPRWRSLERAPW